jgi:hypothetical protein
VDLRSLSDAKLAKDVFQQVIGGDLAGDFAQVEQAPAYVHGQEVGSNLLVQSV